MVLNWLLVIRGKDPGRRHKLSPGQTCSIGREKSNDIRLADEEVSRKHAEIIAEKDLITIVDLSSSNGTFVNGERVKVAVIKKGDHVSIGQTTFMVTSVTPEESLLPKSSGQLASSMLEETDTNFDSDDASVTDELEDSDQWVSSVKSNLQFMYGATIATSQASEIDPLLEKILDLIFDWLSVDRGCILLWNDKQRKYKPRATRYRTNGSKRIELKISSTIVNYVSERKEGILTSNAPEDERLAGNRSILINGVHEAICVPIRGRSAIHGFIYLDTVLPDGAEDSPEPRFNEDHLKLMVAIGHQVAVIIENEEYFSALVESERLTAVGQTLGTLSHHIKNILQSIQGGMHLIEGGLKTKQFEVIEKGWNIVRRNQRNISTLVMDMVTISKPVEPHRKREDLNRTIERAIREVAGEEENREITVFWKPNPIVNKCHYDDALIERAIQNVLKQIVDASREGRDGSMSIELKNSQNNIRIVIQDNFQVVSDSKLEAFFQPFAYEGEVAIHGIGLAVTQKIFRDHDGDVDVTRRSKKGLRFVLRLPIIKSDNDQPTGTINLNDLRTHRGSTV